MFLNKLMEQNPDLIQTIYQLHQNGEITPDSYVIDVDQLLNNAEMMLNEAKKYEIKMFVMLKQIGRNPLLAKKLVDMGYDGVVAVDYKEALLMMEHNIHLAHVGHLVQIPKKLLMKIMAYGVDYITVYSYEKAEEINSIAKELGIVQKLVVKVNGQGDQLYNMQESGIELSVLENFSKHIQLLDNVKISGVTSFPCFLFNGVKIEATANMETILQAKNILEDLGCHIELVNTPSSSCSCMLADMKKAGGNCGEPGHGLTGTTPAHAKLNLIERQCIAYVSEISHQFKGTSYCFGGGYYRRSHIKNALVYMSNENSKVVEVIAPCNESIDYHFGLRCEVPISTLVIMAFRFQIFVTRSDVILIEGIQNDNPNIIGRYNSLGGLL